MPLVFCMPKRLLDRAALVGGIQDNLTIVAERWSMLRGTSLLEAGSVLHMCALSLGKDMRKQEVYEVSEKSVSGL